MSFVFCLQVDAGGSFLLCTAAAPEVTPLPELPSFAVADFESVAGNWLEQCKFREAQVE